MRKSDRRPPIDIDLGIKEGFASFTNSRDRENRIGYRFFEHSPMTWGEIPDTAEETSRNRFNWEGSGTDLPFCAPTLYLREITGAAEGWTLQSWAYRMQPVEDGIELLWTVRTKETGLPAFYGVQQCFRMSGRRNEEWRRRIALAPLFSEFDLWHDEGGDGAATSLTYVVRHNGWHALPTSRETVGAPTRYGCRIDQMRCRGNPPDAIGPYQATMLSPVDCGLITRIDRKGQWVCGIYWERTTHVTDHHPADCLHAIVNIGDIAPNSQRQIRGKIYWFEGSKDDLLERWRREFGEK